MLEKYLQLQRYQRLLSFIFVCVWLKNSLIRFLMRWVGEGSKSSYLLLILKGNPFQRFPMQDEKVWVSDETYKDGKRLSLAK